MVHLSSSEVPIVLLLLEESWAEYCWHFQAMLGLSLELCSFPSFIQENYLSDFALADSTMHVFSITNKKECAICELLSATTSESAFHHPYI